MRRRSDRPCRETLRFDHEMPDPYADRSPSGSPERRRPSHLAHRAALGLRQPVVVVLVLAGAVDLVSEDTYVHGALLLLVAAALAADAFLGRAEVEAVADGPAAPTSVAVEPAPRRITPPVVVAAVAYVVLAGAFARYSWPSSLAVALPGAAGVGVAWRVPSRRSSGSSPLPGSGALAWAAAFVSFALLELSQLLLQPSLTQGSYDHPTLSVLMDSVLASYAGRSAFLAVWLLAGWYLLER